MLAAPITIPVPAQGVSHSPNHALLNNFEINPTSIIIMTLYMNY